MSEYAHAVSFSQFFHLYDLKVLEGEIPQKFESWSDYKIILNKAAMKAMGYARMEDAFCTKRVTAFG